MICKMNVMVNRVMLGNRELGWEVWNGRCAEKMCINGRRFS